MLIVGSRGLSTFGRFKFVRFCFLCWGNSSPNLIPDFFSLVSLPWSIRIINGSVSDYLVHNAKCPVLVFKKKLEKTSESAPQELPQAQETMIHDRLHRLSLGEAEVEAGRRRGGEEARDEVIFEAQEVGQPEPPLALKLQAPVEASKSQEAIKEHSQ